MRRAIKQAMIGSIAALAMGLTGCAAGSSTPKSSVIVEPSSTATPSASATESRTSAAPPSERSRTAPAHTATSAASRPTVPATRTVRMTLWVNPKWIEGTISGTGEVQLTLFVDGKQVAPKKEGKSVALKVSRQGREDATLEARANGHLVGEAEVRLTNDVTPAPITVGLVQVGATYNGKVVTATSGRALMIGNQFDMEGYLIRNYGSDREVLDTVGKERTDEKDGLMPSCAIESIQKEEIPSTCGARLVHSQPTHADSVETEVKSTNGNVNAYIPVDARLYPASLGG